MGQGMDECLQGDFVDSGGQIIWGKFSFFSF